MSILTLFVVIPVLMLLGLWLARNLNQVRGVMVVGSTLLLAFSIYPSAQCRQPRRDAFHSQPHVVCSAQHCLFGGS